jgi:hypothetical protein
MAVASCSETAFPQSTLIAPKLSPTPFPLPSSHSTIPIG